MYAVIKAGGKQQKVKPGDVIEVELIHGGHGDDITFTPILVVDDEGGTHFGKELGKAVVKAKLLGEEKGDKVKIFKYRPKTGYAKRQGHRQMHSLVEIEDVVFSKRAGAKKADDEEGAEASPAPTPEEVAAESPVKKSTRSSAASKSRRTTKGRA